MDSGGLKMRPDLNNDEMNQNSFRKLKSAWTDKSVVWFVLSWSVSLIVSLWIIQTQKVLSWPLTASGKTLDNLTICISMENHKTRFRSSVNSKCSVVLRIRPHTWCALLRAKRNLPYRNHYNAQGKSDLKSAVHWKRIIRIRTIKQTFLHNLLTLTLQISHLLYVHWLKSIN